MLFYDENRFEDEKYDYWKYFGKKANQKMNYILL